jgi:predicted esterase
MRMVVPVARICSSLLRSAAVLLMVAAGGCAGGGFQIGSRTSATGIASPPGALPGFTANTFTREGLASGASATEAGCRALADGLWVGTADGRRECLRYAMAGAAQGPGPRLALVHIPGDASGMAYRFVGGRPQVAGAGEGYEASAESRRAAAEVLSEALGGRPVVLMGRPGMHGSSGHHARDRHSRAEVELVDAALTELRRRHGFQGFVLSGFSSGGAVVANLLARRADIRCAAIASAPLDLAAFYRSPDGVLPDHFAMRGGELADPMRTVRAVRADTAVFVLGDPRDRKVPPAAWLAWVDAARRAGLRVSAAEVSGFDPAEGGGAVSYHQTSARAIEVALSCAAGDLGSPPRGPSPSEESGAGGVTVARLQHASEARR